MNQDRTMDALREVLLPAFDRLIMERFPDTYMRIPDMLINFVVEDVHRDRAWQAEGTFTDGDVSRAIQEELMICIREILGKQATERYQGREANPPREGQSDLIHYDRIGIQELSPLDVQQDISIGDGAIVMGQIDGGAHSGKYLCACRRHENGRFRYTDVAVSGDYFAILRAFSRQIKAQADRTRDQIASPSLEGVDLSPIDARHCRPLSQDDMLVGKVVVIRADALRPEYRAATCQLRLCTGGFGAHPHSRGSACFCRSLLTGKEGRFEREDILGTLAPDQLPTWAKQKLDEVRKKERDSRKGEER